MRIERQLLEGIAVVSVAEPVEIDVSNVDAFKQAALSAVGDDRLVALDASLVEFFDSAGMGALLSIQKRIAERGGRLVLAGLNRAVQDIFRMVGFDVVFVIYPDVASAVAALRERA